MIMRNLLRLLPIITSMTFLNKGKKLFEFLLVFALLTTL